MGLLVFVIAEAQTQSALRVEFVSVGVDSKNACVEVLGLRPAALQRMRNATWKQSQWQRVLAVRVEIGGKPSDLSMLGRYRMLPDRIRFEPQFPLAPGGRYRASFYPAAAGIAGHSAPVEAVYEVAPAAAAAVTEVAKIYPSAAIVPENLLKFYLHFTAPMSRGRSYEHIHLLDAAGREIELPFLEIGEELWNPAMTRLTLFIDPGRIKRGVLPLEQIGPSLEEGKQYRLRIDEDWLDAQGKPLRQAFEREVRVGPPDRTAPDPAMWSIDVPRAGSTDPLRIRFSDPMDQALAERMITIQSPAGLMVQGSVQITNEEREWMFTPAMPWPRGSHQIAIPSTIEDLAGNNIGKTFEVDRFDRVERTFSAKVITLPIEIR